VGEEKPAAAEVKVVPCGAERADDVHRLTQAAFAPYARLQPPSGAVAESVEHVAAVLTAGGGAVAERAGVAVGCLRWSLRDGGDLYVGRVAVDPGEQGSGIGRALMAWAEAEARRRGCGALSVGVRVALPENLAYFQRMGFVVTGEHRHDGFEQPTWLSLRKDLAAETPRAMTRDG
jgi:GNAT superfamily N-acetyltransferase